MSYFHEEVQEGQFVSELLQRHPKNHLSAIFVPPINKFHFIDTLPKLVLHLGIYRGSVWVNIYILTKE